MYINIYAYTYIPAFGVRLVCRRLVGVRVLLRMSLQVPVLHRVVGQGPAWVGTGVM